MKARKVKEADPTPRYRNGALLCNFHGNTCGAVAIKGKTKCRTHGGKSTGRPPVHGRGSRYAAIFGESFESLLRDPELRNTAPELALFDQFLTERAEVVKRGLSAEWLQQLAEVDAELQTALTVTKDGAKVKACAELLHTLIAEGGSVNAAWLELLAAARPRAEIALKAEAVIVKRDSAVTESNMIVLFGKMLDVITDVLGHEQARKVQARFAAECGFGVEQGAGSASGVAGSAAN